MKGNSMTIKVIGFDADDTLWHNEDTFHKVEKYFCQMLPDKCPVLIKEHLLKIETDNLSCYGYGVKGFILSLIETYLKINDGQFENGKMEKLLILGKEMLDSPVRLLPYAQNSLKMLSKKYTLVLITKGDLLDQETKIKRSGLSTYFNYLEIVSEKDDLTYAKTLSKYKINPTTFMMIGNSLRSDILPALAIGASAIHIPYKITWAHEDVKINQANESYVRLKDISEVFGWLEKHHNLGSQL